MSKVVITRKIPIRTVSKANNNTNPTATTTSEPAINTTTQEPSSPLIPSSSANATEQQTITKPTTTTPNPNNTNQITNTTTVNTSPTNNNSSAQQQQQQQQQSIIQSSHITEEEDVYNPKITYEETEKQALKFRKFSKAFIISKKKEQVRFYLPKVEQVVQRDSKCSIVPLSMCILYHRQNGGEYALCIFKDKKMVDLCPFSMEKTEISIVLNQTNSKQRSLLQILSENFQGMNVEYYLQFESEMQLLSVYSALDKSLMYNGSDIKESIPTFNSLLVTYSSRQMKDTQVTSPRAAPVKYKWCEKYVEQYSTTSVIPESLRSSEKKQVRSFRKTEENNYSSDSSTTSRGARLSQTENNYSPVDESRRRYLEDNDESLGSRHFIPSGDENGDSDSGRRRHREAIIAKSSPLLSSPLFERKLEEDKYRPTPSTANENSDGETSPIPKIIQEPTPQETSPTTSTGTKKVIKRVVKRVPAKNTTE